MNLAEHVERSERSNFYLYICSNISETVYAMTNVSMKRIPSPFSLH